MDEKLRQQLEEQLSAYIDDELSPEERQEVETLLAVDAEARALLAELWVTTESVRSLPRARASDDLLETMRSRLERQALLGEVPTEHHARRSRVSLSGHWVAAAAVIAMTTVAGYIMWSFRDHGSATLVSRDQFVMRTDDMLKPPGLPAASSEGLSRAQAKGDTGQSIERVEEAEESAIDIEKPSDRDIKTRDRAAKVEERQFGSIATDKEKSVADEVDTRGSGTNTVMESATADRLQANGVAKIRDDQSQGPSLAHNKRAWGLATQPSVSDFDSKLGQRFGMFLRKLKAASLRSSSASSVPADDVVVTTRAAKKSVGRRRAESRPALDADERGVRAMIDLPIRPTEAAATLPADLTKHGDEVDSRDAISDTRLLRPNQPVALATGKIPPASRQTTLPTTVPVPLRIRTVTSQPTSQPHDTSSDSAINPHRNPR